MTTPTTMAADHEADVRWQDWLARGAARERRSAIHVRGLMVVIVAAVILLAIVQLT